MKIDDSNSAAGTALAAESSSVKKPRKATRDAEGSIFKRVEERRASNGKTKKITFYLARVRYTDNDGNRCEKTRRCASYNDAVIKRRELRADIKKELAAELEPEKPKLFSEVIDHYEQEYVKEAEYSGNEKVSGLREPLRVARRHLEIFRQEFGEKTVDKITFDDIRNFKNKRLSAMVEIEITVKTPLTETEKAAYKEKKSYNRKYKYQKVKRTSPRAVASVNRELARLRRIFNIAVRQNWLDKSPFHKGESVISAAAEVERVRILSMDEEKRLLAACVGRREHLKAVLICALDTALRKNELLTLTWGDVDLDKRTIKVKALNSKTLKPRSVPISSRLEKELENLQENSFDTNEGSRIFGLSDIKKAFYGAVREAKVEDFRFHDLRGTAITRLLRAGMPPAEVMKISGHSQFRTFSRYVKIDDDTIERARNALDAYLENLH
jgi:integrase